MASFVRSLLAASTTRYFRLGERAVMWSGGRNEEEEDEEDGV